MTVILYTDWICDLTVTLERLQAGNMIGHLDSGMQISVMCWYLKENLRET